MGERATIFGGTLALLGAALSTHAAGSSTVKQTAPAVDEQSRNLARDLVLAETQDGSVANFTLLERAIALPISNTLASGSPKPQAELASKVHDQLTPWREEYTEALVEAYSRNLTASQMRDIIAFLQGPGGRAEAANLPFLKKSLASALAMEPDAVAKMETDSKIAYQQAPQARRDLIERIFKAQNLEEQTRQGFRKLYSTMSAAVAGAMNAASADTAKDTNVRPLYEKDEMNKQVEADVQRTMAIERSFYLTHYSDEELSVAATYLESDAGQAVMMQLPTIRRAVGSNMAAKLDGRLPNLIESLCAATSCSAEQRDSLNRFMNALRKGMQSALAQ